MSALSLDAVAVELGVCVRTVRREIAAGKLAAFRVRRVLRVDGDEFARYRSTLCLSASEEIGGKSASPSAMADDLNARCRPAPAAATRSTRKLTFGASRSTSQQGATRRA